MSPAELIREVVSILKHKQWATRSICHVKSCDHHTTVFILSSWLVVFLSKIVNICKSVLKFYQGHIIYFDISKNIHCKQNHLDKWCSWARLSIYANVCFNFTKNTSFILTSAGIYASSTILTSGASPRIFIVNTSCVLEQDCQYMQKCA